jgi:hypothetical protein
MRRENLCGCHPLLCSKSREVSRKKALKVVYFLGTRELLLSATARILNPSFVYSTAMELVDRQRFEKRAAHAQRESMWLSSIVVPKITEVSRKKGLKRTGWGKISMTVYARAASRRRRARARGVRPRKIINKSEGLQKEPQCCRREWLK